MNKAERIRQNGSPIIGFNIRRLREQKRLWNMVAKLLSFPTHIHATHPNALFPAIFFMCNPILRELVSVGGIFFSRTALPNGVFWSRGLTKATRPLICTHLDPHLSPVYAFYFDCPVLPVSMIGDCFAKSSHGLTRSSGSLSDLTNSIATKGWRGTAVFTEIEKDAQLSLKRLVSVAIASQTSVCNAILDCFQLIVSHLLSQMFIFFLVLFSPFSYAKSI